MDSLVLWHDVNASLLTARSVAFSVLTFHFSVNGCQMSHSKILPPQPTRHLARLTFVAFLFTFIASRTLVILIMTRRMPDLFLHLGGTHVHHLNYGIFLLSTVAGLLLFARLDDKPRSACALLYGIGLAVTFD